MPLGPWARFVARTARASASASVVLPPRIRLFAAARAAASAAFWSERRSMRKRPTSNAIPAAPRSATIPRAKRTRTCPREAVPPAARPRSQARIS